MYTSIIYSSKQQEKKRQSLLMNSTGRWYMFSEFSCAVWTSFDRVFYVCKVHTKKRAFRHAMLTNEMGFQRTFAFVRNFTDITLHYRLRGSKGKQKSFFLIGERLLIFSPLMIFCAGALLSHACRKTCRGLNVCSSRPVSSSRQQLLSLVPGGSRQQN